MYRRSTRCVFGVAMSVVFAAAITGCHANTPGISDSCTTPSTLNDGMFANRTAYFRIATQQDPTNASTTWVCYRIKAADTPETAGRIQVNPNTGIGAARVSADTNSRACAAASGNLVPGPHPLQGELLETPFYLDANANLSPTAWVCLEVGGLKERLMVEVPGADIADVDSNDDPAPAPITDTTPPPVGKASTTCSTGTYGASNELINAHLHNTDVFLYTAQPAQNQLHVCARISGAQSGGGHLAVTADPNQVVRLDTSSDTTACTQDVVTLSTPPVSIKTSPITPGSTSICVNGTRYTVVTGSASSVVSFTPDS